MSSSQTIWNYCINLSFQERYPFQHFIISSNSFIPTSKNLINWWKFSIFFHRQACVDSEAISILICTSKLSLFTVSLEKTDSAAPRELFLLYMYTDTDCFKGSNSGMLGNKDARSLAAFYNLTIKVYLTEKQPKNIFNNNFLSTRNKIFNAVDIAPAVIYVPLHFFSLHYKLPYFKPHHIPSADDISSNTVYKFFFIKFKIHL